MPRNVLLRFSSLTDIFSKQLEKHFIIIARTENINFWNGQQNTFERWVIHQKSQILLPTQEIFEIAEHE